MAMKNIEENTLTYTNVIVKLRMKLLRSFLEALVTDCDRIAGGTSHNVCGHSSPTRTTSWPQHKQ